MKSTDQRTDEKSCLLPEVTAAVELAEPVLDITLEPIGARRQTDTAVSFENGVAVFTTWDQNNRIVYTVDTSHEKVQQGLLHITASFNGSVPVTAVTDAGVAYLTLQGETLSPAAFAGAADVEMEVRFDEAAQRLTIATGTLDNVVATVDVPAGAPVANEYPLELAAGDVIYLIYTPKTPAEGVHFGVMNTITFVK